MEHMMRVKLLLGISMMLLSLAASAQSNSDQQNTTSPTGSSDSMTVRGCLTGSAGTYVLVADDKGKPYMLQGNKSDLDQMIRHEVEITGKLMHQTGSDQGQATSTGDNNRAQPPGATLQVSSVREVSNTCAAKMSR
jgi:hypothetical protein